MQSAIDIHPQDFMVLMDETIGDRSIVTLLRDGLSELPGVYHLPDGPHKGVYHLTAEVPRDPEVAARDRVTVINSTPESRAYLETLKP
jgi:hypothetical protein